MTFRHHYKLVDDVTDHFDNAVKNIDAFIQSRYVGFFAVASVSVVELTYKQIMLDFANRTHPTFGTYFESQYENLNARVKLKHIAADLTRLGGSFQPRFEDRLSKIEDYSLKRRKVSVRSSYGSLIACRHDFAHEGRVPQNVSYREVRNGYEAAKVVMACVAKTLRET